MFRRSDGRLDRRNGDVAGDRRRRCHLRVDEHSTADGTRRMRADVDIRRKSLRSRGITNYIRGGGVGEGMCQQYVRLVLFGPRSEFSQRSLLGQHMGAASLSHNGRLGRPAPDSLRHTLLGRYFLRAYFCNFSHRMFTVCPYGESLFSFSVQSIYRSLLLLTSDVHFASCDDCRWVLSA